jgi:uncharacterized protein (DUF2336 family)
MAEPLAKSPPGTSPSISPRVLASVDRQRLMAAMINLCEASHGRASPEAHTLVESIFLDLVKRAERDMRLHLADQLATAPWAPSGLINALALDDIEIARPVIAKSPLLKDHDLVRLLTTATIEHQIEVARRPGLGADMVKVILDQGDPVVLGALAGNESADVSEFSMTRLVAFSRKIVSLRAPLARHPKLTLELACTLYSWVGDALKSEIISRFHIDGPALDQALRQSVAESLGGASAPHPHVSGEAGERREMETRLIAKLEAAGQLRPGFLLRALREGKLHLFEVALASLANVRTEDVKAATNSDRPELLALVCSEIGIDRSVFPTILSLVRGLNQSRPNVTAASLKDVNAAFTLKGKGEALAAFRCGVSAL